AHPWCGVFVIDLRSGDLAGWIRLGSEDTELVDVALIPNVRCPMALEPDTPQMQDAIRFEEEWDVGKPAVGPVQGAWGGAGRAAGWKGGGVEWRSWGGGEDGMEGRDV